MRGLKIIIIHILIFPFFLLLYGLVVSLKRTQKDRVKSKPRLVWGPVPLISNKYWSNALKKSGYESLTLMSLFYSSINKKSDFDLYTYQLPFVNKLPSFIAPFSSAYLISYYSFLYSIWKFDIFHHHFHGGFLADTPVWYLEAHLIKWANCKSVITAYGADYYRYSTIPDINLRHALLSDYPLAARMEAKIEKRVKYWVKNADIVISGFQTEGIGRWDVFPYSIITIDVSLWKMKKKYSDGDGRKDVVKVIHTPNHRTFKGTGFLIQVINQLKKEGFKVELILIEKMQNDKLKEIMKGADILVEQLLTGYALSAMEGMATGLPVLSNITNPKTKAFRRFSYLGECPIVPVDIESLKTNLKILIKDPKLRIKLGRAGRSYVEKYHSDETAVYMFSKIYDKIWFKKDIDLINLFHPLISEFNNQKPVIKPPLAQFGKYLT